MNHKCPVNGCEAQLPRHILMCSNHWRMVPKAVQREVNAAWAAFSRDAASYEKVYFAIRDAAIAVVHRKLKEPAGAILPVTLAFLVGVSIAIVLVLAIGAGTAFRVWGAIALVLTVVFLFGLVGARPAAPATKRMRPTCRAVERKDARDTKDQSATEVHDYWYQAKKNQEACRSLDAFKKPTTDDKIAMREEIARRMAISKTK